MKKALCLALVIPRLADPVLGAEKIEGAFGFTFGQKYEPTTPMLERTKDYNFHDVYSVTPPTPNAQFVTYYVRLTPVTHLITTIIAVGKSIDGDAGVQAEQAIEAYLQAKYGEDSRKFASEIHQDHRQITVGGAHNPARTITNVYYTDSDLGVQADHEQAQLDAARAADHAQQLLKTFDGTGM